MLLLGLVDSAAMEGAAATLIPFFLSRQTETSMKNREPKEMPPPPPKLFLSG